MAQMAYGTAAPTDTTQSWALGDIVLNSAPTAIGQPYGWVCIAAGYPGTWAVIQLEYLAPVATSTITTGQLPNGNRVLLLNPGSAVSMTLPSSAAHAAGALMTIKNISANTVTLVAATGQNYEGAINITLAQNAIANIVRDTTGTTQWWKAA